MTYKRKDNLKTIYISPDHKIKLKFIADKHRRTQKTVIESIIDVLYEQQQDDS